MDWEDPPQAPRSGRWPVITANVQELQKYPGKWARIRSLPSGQKGYADPYLSRGCETAIRRTADGWGLWARWPE